MFEAAELGNTVSKEEYRTAAERLRVELLDLQRQLRERAGFPVILVFAGVDGAGKSEMATLLTEWMDPRWIVTRAFGEPSDEERERPPYWRYWRALPPRGRIGLFLSSWYSRPNLDRVYRRISAAGLDEELNRIAAFERTLADDGAVILKFWMHLGKTAQKKRLKTLEADPLTRWRVTKKQWKHWGMYERFIAAAERTIQRTSTGRAPWAIVEGADPRYRSLRVGRLVRDALRERLASNPSASRGVSRLVRAAGSDNTRAAQTSRSTHHESILERLQMSHTVDKEKFRRDLERWQGRLYDLHHKASVRGMSAMLVFEGWDAAGKGGAVRRVTSALEPHAYQIIPIAAPNEEERGYHYLWRFWRHVARAGTLTIFDRSWYGRVLVERVEGFAPAADWQRAYAEINEFEEQLVEHGIVVAKFWLHITRDEQLRRFKAREVSPVKNWKLTDEDWRNRKKWHDYAAAVNDMVERTSTPPAPWTLVEANDKYHARLKVLETACRRLEAALKK
jgi:polyphosphate:AMP phosphotransferase